MLLATNQKSSIETLVDLLLQVFPRVLGLMLVYAGILKVTDHSRMLVVLEFDGFPAWLVPYLARTVIGSEIVLGAMLILFRPRPWLMAVAGAVLIVYSAQLLFLVMSEDAPPCGCMELKAALRFREAEDQSNKMGLYRNIVLLVATFLTWLQLPRAPQTSQPGPTGLETIPKENP